MIKIIKKYNKKIKKEINKVKDLLKQILFYIPLRTLDKF